ncbi:MAG: Ldh family oxidoreductase [bacterium]|nr:Ldh family oxidoreductase [bacterium]
MPVFSGEELRRIGREIYERAGATPEEAETVAGLLVESSLMGHDSHGVMRLPQYVTAIENGQIRPGAKVEVERETAASAVLNGNWGFGHVTAAEAMKIAMQKAKEASVGLVTVHQCNHVGRLGAYPPLASDADMIGMLTNNGHGADLAMVPWGGIGRVLPANCLSVAIPSAGEFPVVLDLTTAVAAGGKVRVTLARGEKMPDGWMVDHEGNPTNDPEDYVTDPKGALLPFGGAVGHKGYGLAFVIDILSGALSPAGCSREKSEVSGNALFVQVINVEAFQPLDAFKEEVKRFIEYVKSAKPAPGSTEVLVPGERSYRAKQKRLEEGIPVEETTWERIAETAKKLGVKV